VISHFCRMNRFFGSLGLFQNKKEKPRTDSSKIFSFLKDFCTAF
jgi:hypothetical protein